MGGGGGGRRGGHGWQSVGKYYRQMYQVGKGKVCIRARRPIKSTLITPVSVACSDYEYCCSPVDRMLVHRKVTPQHYDCRYPFIHLGEERQCEIKFLV